MKFETRVVMFPLIVLLLVMSFYSGDIDAQAAKDEVAEYMDSDQYYDDLVYRDGMICDIFNQCWPAKRFCCMSTCTPSYELPGQETVDMCTGWSSYNSPPRSRSYSNGRHGYM